MDAIYQLASALLSLIIALTVIVAIIALYMLPAIVAWLRHHHNFVMILVLDIFLGWTFIGWVVFLAMAFSNPPPKS